MMPPLPRGKAVPGPRVSLTGLMFAIFCVASVVLLFKLFKRPDTAYTPVEGGGVFQPRNDEEDPRAQKATEPNSFSSLEFIPRKQVALSPDYRPSSLPPEQPAPPDFQPAPPAAEETAPAPPPAKPRIEMVKPKFNPMPESKTASGITSSAFLAAPKPAEQAKSGTATSEPAKEPAASGRTSSPKQKDRRMRDILTGR